MGLSHDVMAVLTAMTSAGIYRFLAASAGRTRLAAGRTIRQVAHHKGLKGDDESFRTGLGRMQLRYGRPASPPAVPVDKAIIAVRSVHGTLVDEATSVEVRYVLFSNDTERVEDESGIERLVLQNVPAWIVTLEGIDVPSRGTRGGGVKPHNHELHVVVDARTGEYLRYYTFR